MEVDADSNRSS